MYYILYGGVAIFLCSVTIFHQKVVGNVKFRAILLFILVLFLTLFSGTRTPNVDHDYQNYTQWIDSIGNSYNDAILQGKDIGFILLYQFSSLFSESYILFFCLICLLSLIFKWKFSTSIYNGRFCILIFFLIFSRFYILHDMTQVRAGMAIAMSSYGIVLLTKGKRKYGIILVSLAGLIHLSSLFLMVVYGLYLCVKNKKLISPLMMLLPIAGLFMGEALKTVLPLLNAERLNIYLSGGYATEKISLLSFYYLIRIIVFYFLMIFFFHQIKKEQRICLFFSSMSLFFHAALVWNDAVALRVVEILGLFDIATFTFPLLFLNKSSRQIYICFLLLISFVFYISSLKIVNPYESYFF